MNGSEQLDSFLVITQKFSRLPVIHIIESLQVLYRDQ